jgi:hypothetical protein
MVVKATRYLVAAAAWLSLWSATSVGVAAPAHAGSVDPAAAAAACAGQPTHGRRAATSGGAPLTRTVSCVLRAERAQLGLRYTRSAVLSRMVDDALGQFIALPYLAERQPQLARQAEQAAAQSMVKSFCRGAGPGISRAGWDFAYRKVPPALSALAIAKLLAAYLQAPGAIEARAGAVFGVSARPGLLFEHGERGGDSLGVVAITCA